MTLARALVIASLAAIGLATLTPQATTTDVGHFCVICGEFGTVDALLNVVLFVPLGIGLGRTRMRLPWAVVAGCACSLLIELAQLFVVPGRHANVGDVAMNTVGTAAGFALAIAGRHALLPQAKLASRLLAAWIGLWIAMQLLTAYSFTPVFPEPPYYRQMNRTAPGRDSFPGTVISATVGDEFLPAPQLNNAERLKTSLLQRRGVPVRVVVVTSGVAPSAEILKVSGPRLENLLSFDQVTRGFVFGIRTGADALRLRPLAYRLPDVFDAAAGPDTIVLLAHHTSSGVLLSAVSGRRALTQRRSHVLSSGWRLFLPFQSYVDGSRLGLLAAMAYLILLSAPAGYLSAFVGWPGDGAIVWRRAATFGGGTALVFMVSLAVIARLFALRLPPAWEYLAVIVGTVIGFLIGGRVASLHRGRGARRHEPHGCL